MNTNLIATLVVVLTTNWTHVGEFKDQSVFVGVRETNRMVRVTMPDGGKQSFLSGQDICPMPIFKLEKQTNIVISGTTTNTQKFWWNGIFLTNDIINL